MTAYYNEFDKYAAQHLRNLIDAGHIAPGIVDERSIESRPVHGHLVEWRLPAVAQEERAVAQEERAVALSFRTAFALRRRRDVRVPA